MLYLVDELYVIRERLGAKKDVPRNMVFLVEEISTRNLKVIKIYTEDEIKTFLRESENNSFLNSHPYLVLAERIVYIKQSMEPLEVNGI